MSAVPSRLGARLSSSALALVSMCVLVLAGFVDRAVVSRIGERTVHGAIEAGAILSSFLAARAEALGALQEPVAAQGEPDEAGVARIVAAHRDRLADFRTVWIADSTGRVRAAAAPAGGTSILPPAGTLAQLAREARAAPFVRVSRFAPIGEDRRGLILLEPVRARSGVVGYSGGSIDSATLALALRMSTPPRASRTLLVAGGDTLVAIGRPSSDAHAAEGSVRVPDGTRWRVLVVAPAGAGSLRVLLWGVTVGALALLALALVYERKQARRIAERSAELEHLSQELLRANRSKSEFLANVSHELRTPLNAIVGFADLLRDGVYGELGPRQVGPVERIEASANHLRHLVDQILDLAKMAAGRLEVHTETVDLRPFVFQVASEMESLVHEKGLTMSLSVGATLPRVRTDPAHLRQILVNLLGNAVKFTQHGGITVRARLVQPGASRAAVSIETPVEAHVGAEVPVVVPAGVPVGDAERAAVAASASPAASPSRPLANGAFAALDERALAALARLRAGSARPEGRWIALQVFDTGIGIPERDRERIFDEFEQVNAGPRGDSMRRGTGLGLSISRRLAHLLGGDITLESEVGRGSVFTLWLPVD